MKVLFAFVITFFCSLMYAAEAPLSPNDLLISAQALIKQADEASDPVVRQAKTNQATDLLRSSVNQYPKNTTLITMFAVHLKESGLLGEAALVTTQALNLEETSQLLNLEKSITKELKKLSRSKNISGINILKYLDSGDYLTAIAVSDLAIEKWPNKDIYYQYKGEALYKFKDLERAEDVLMKALQLNPQNEVAKNYVEEIRTTLSAREDADIAEWISIGKDKVGDFIVTFLALFAAFLTNSLVAPLLLRLKLKSARNSFLEGDYDIFTDLLERLLDLEDFGPIRKNFQFLLMHKSLEEATEFLNKYVNTLDRLPTLQRILEREHEKMLDAK